MYKIKNGAPPTEKINKSNLKGGTALDWLLQIDQVILSWFQSLHTGWLDGLMVFITSLGNYGGIWFAAGIALLFFPRYRRYGILLIAGVITGYLLGDLVLKPLVARPRPFVSLPAAELLIPPPHSYSFPSGHALSSFAAATALFLADKRLGIPACILAAFIAFSRPYLFVHYPTDVLAGALLGVVIVFALYGVGKKCGFFPT